MNQGLKLALELGPLIVFFVANSQGGIMVGTAAFVIATAIALTVSLIVARKVPVMPLVSGVFVLGFGGLTLLLDDDLFIKLKPTIVNLLFASAIFVGLKFGRNPLKLVLEGAFRMDEDGWSKLSIRWALFFILLACLNEIVWRGFSTDFWVSFKVFGIMPLTILFSLTQLPLMMRHKLEDDDEAKSDKAEADEKAR